MPMMTDAKAALVLGMAVNSGTHHAYTPKPLGLFVLSFRRHMDCDIVLFTKNLEEATLCWLRERGVVCLELGDSGDMPVNYRFFAYKAYLQTRPAHDWVFMTDVRDVLAQGDIFARFRSAPGLHIFLEAPRKRIASCKLNSHWMLEAYGPDALAAHGQKRISCVGTVLADKKACLAYLEALTGQMMRPAPSGGDRMGLFGMDTAAHLHLYHSGELYRLAKQCGGRLHAHENGDGVLTADHLAPLLLSENDDIVLQDGSVPAIVHQYDRFPSVRDALERRYALRAPL